jgi:CO/xanthine dehydrogenase FAD-binding subunit
MLIKTNFEYFAPKTLKKALELLTRYPEDSKVLAGGQSLLVLMKQGLVSPRYLIDIKNVAGLDYIKPDKKQGLLIGALTSHREVETSPWVRSNFMVLVEMEQRLASLETRNWGTIGGNLCHADPAGDVCPVLVALGATVKISGVNSERRMSVEDFSVNYFETALQHDELLTEIRIPYPGPNTGVAYEKFNVTRNDYATTSVAVSMTLSGSNKCSSVMVVLGAVAPVPLRVRRAEEILLGQIIKPALLEQAAQIAMDEVEPVSDMHASDKFKRKLCKALVQSVGQLAWERAQKA